MLPNPEETVLKFVRGERPPAELEKAGLFLELTPDGWRIDNPWNIVVRVEPADVAKGILNLRHAPEALGRWAAIVLAGSGFIELSDDFDADLKLMLSREFSGILPRNNLRLKRGLRLRAQ